jgi:hypothetical protein
MLKSSKQQQVKIRQNGKLIVKPMSEIIPKIVRSGSNLLLHYYINNPSAENIREKDKENYQILNYIM